MENYYGINVFISSPGDMIAERNACVAVIKKLNNTRKEELKVFFNEKTFERMIPTVVETGKSLQEGVDKEIPMRSIDIFICILGNRMGTPIFDTHTKKMLYKSGTIKEFKDAYSLWEKSGKKVPHILIYHKIKKINFEKGSEDEKQYNDVQEFLENFQSHKEHPGKIQNFTKLKEFKELIENHLLSYMLKFSNQLKSIRSKSDGNINDIWKSFAEKMYLQSASNVHPNPSGEVYFSYDNVSFPVTADSSQRTRDKNELMKDVNEIRMMAHAGYSYLDIYANRMRNTVEQCLIHGGVFKIILTNPYSYSGLLISIADGAEKNADYVLKSVLKRLRKSDDQKEVISQIENSQWFAHKQRGAIEGYLRFKDKFMNQIQLRMLGFDMYATTLITEKGAFIEPYLIVSREEQRGMSTFEVQVGTQSYIYKNVEENFEILWQLAEPYEIYVKKIERYKDNLCADIGMLLDGLDHK